MAEPQLDTFEVTVKKNPTPGQESSTNSAGNQDLAKRFAALRDIPQERDNGGATASGSLGGGKLRRKSNKKRKGKSNKRKVNSKRKRKPKRKSRKGLRRL